MRLAEISQLHVAERKITHYLLDLSSEEGKSKADFFLRFGFTLEAWQILAQALAAHAQQHEITKVEVTVHGTMYEVEGEIKTPDQRDPYIRTVWIVEGKPTDARFVTAYPTKRKKTL